MQWRRRRKQQQAVTAAVQNISETGGAPTTKVQIVSSRPSISIWPLGMLSSITIVSGEVTRRVFCWEPFGLPNVVRGMAGRP